MSFQTCMSNLFALHTNTDTLKNALTVHTMRHFSKYLLLSTEESVRGLEQHYVVTVFTHLI